MNSDIESNINDATRDIEEVLEVVDSQLQSLIEEMFENKFDNDYIDTVIKIRKKDIPKINELLSKIDDEADDIETECDECEARGFDDDVTPDWETINANEEIQWSATNFVDKQVMERLNELYENKYTSLQILEYLNNIH